MALWLYFNVGEKFRSLEIILYLNYTLTLDQLLWFKLLGS